MSEENGPKQIDEAKREADKELGEMEDDAQAMDERLSANESEGQEIEVPEPGQGEDLSISDPPGEDEPGVGEGDVPEGEGEAAEEAGQ